MGATIVGALGEGEVVMTVRPEQGVDSSPETWRERVLLALGEAPQELSELWLLQEVAARTAHRFTPSDRTYEAGRPRWHVAVREALAGLVAEGLVARGGAPRLTAKGRGRVRRLEPEPLTGEPDTGRRPDAPDAGVSGPPPGGRAPLLTPGVISAPLRDPDAREHMHFPTGDDQRMPVMVELNLRFAGGPRAAFAALSSLWARCAGEPPPSPLAEEYATGMLSMNEMKRLVSADAAPHDWRQRCAYRLWPDFPVQEHVDASSVTVKVDAAQRAFNALGDRIVWAVVDSGVDAAHPQFLGFETLSHPSVSDLHRIFQADGTSAAEGALQDETGHGTHVAGIIAGGLAPWLDDPQVAGRTVLATENRYNAENPTEALRVPREGVDGHRLAGMAPRARLVSLKVLQRGGTLQDRVSRVIAALAYVREVNGQGRAGMRIHGVNLSVGYEFDPEWFGCGQSPLCQEVDKLVRSGVVVVVAAGNSGYGTLGVEAAAPTKFGLAVTINDPGNAERAITVASTHRDMPHTYGVSYFSSKGPTGDGRRKPDLVAPGEQITSCAAGEKLASVTASPSKKQAVYVQDSGTSMAAPHVSGAIAAFLSVRREFIGRPETVTQIVVESATSLGREADFQGSGLLDLMRALQSV